MKYVVIAVGKNVFMADMRLCASGHSCTRNVLEAKVFTDFEEAKRNCCEGEMAISLDDLFER